MKRISFTLTISQVRGQTKTITRRLGWDSLNVGDRLQPIEKGSSREFRLALTDAVWASADFQIVESNKQSIPFP